MPSSIELRFDVASEAAICELWVTASSYYGTDYMLQNGVIPHVALLVSDECLHSVFSSIPPAAMPIALGDIGFFSDGEVVFLHVVENQVLRDYQRACFQAATDRGIRINGYYSPIHWLPHCTIAQECTINRVVPIALPKLDVSIRSLIYVEYPPTTLVAEKPFA